jgi:hypothetical protein
LLLIFPFNDINKSLGCAKLGEKEGCVMHLRNISVAKASSGDDSEDEHGQNSKSASDITAILGGSVQDVLLSLIQALGKTPAT